MKKTLLLPFLLITAIAFANNIVVKNIEELKEANKKARPGDVIVLKNGTWNDVTISLNCNGTKEQPVYFKAQTPGKVIITGNSRLKLGGNFIVVDGLCFMNGAAGDDAVINFRIDNKQLANNCRVTNCVVNDFNNAKRMDENNWVLFYGKNNRLDHCSFINKKNMGVLLAVVLDDERSRENFHSIDHNYFGLRIPLASNGGEIIRVGVSQHCEFNSNTQIIDNYFEHCDGETEIISIKSCENVVRNNLFKECQGGVVLRHGNYNIVEKNIFLGNDKPGTGGVRVINKGQKIIKNVFYKCRGVDFRSPLSVMNGIPNSPAFRYVQVTDAVIEKNTFYNCSPISFCEGSDTERVLPPKNVVFAQNTFYNTNDTNIYKVYDNIDGFSFADNKISKEVRQSLPAGFIKTSVDGNPVVDLKAIQEKAAKNCGAPWSRNTDKKSSAWTQSVNCVNAEQVYALLKKNIPLTIRLTGKEYTLDKPFVISNTVSFTGNPQTVLKFNTGNLMSAFVIGGNGNLILRNLNIDANGVKAGNFISNDSTGSSNHFNLSIYDCTFKNLSKENGSINFFYAYRYMVADSIVIKNCSFLNNHVNGVILNEERDNKGYYNAEKIIITENNFTGQRGVLLNVYRGGNDESTLGPQLFFRNNTIADCLANAPLITLFGVQKSFIEKNDFQNANNASVLIRYNDMVRADHQLKDNSISNSGQIEEDKFVRTY